MNWIDLVVVLALVVAVWNGWKQGFIVQVCSLAGLVAALWLAVHYGAEAGARLGLDPGVAVPGGFAAVLVAVLVAVAIAARAVRKLFHFAGFGLLDILLGVAVSAAKCLVVLCVLVSAFDRLNADHAIAEARTVGNSKTYGPLLRLSDTLCPFLEWAGERIPGSGADEAKE